MSWLTLKAKLYALGALLLAGAAFFFRLKVVTAQRDRAVKKAEEAQAQAHVEKVIRETDAEIYSQYSDLAREANEAAREGRVSDNRRKPSEW